MANSQDVILFLLSFLIHQVSAYYCDNGRCDSTEQYCCGNNVCCSNYAVWQMWYFWCGLVVFMILLSACAAFWHYRQYSSPASLQNGPPYSRLHNSSAPVYSQKSGYLPYRDDNDGSTNALPPKYAPSGPPPPYSSSINMPMGKEKDLSHCQ